jgi:hypothetical protein
MAHMHSGSGTGEAAKGKATKGEAAHASDNNRFHHQEAHDLNSVWFSFRFTPPASKQGKCLQINSL